MNAQQDVADSNSIFCKFCKRRLEAGAVICNCCGHFQNWRSYLNFSHSILALLIALISVSTIALPVLLKVFENEDSNIVISYMYPELKKTFNFTRRPAPYTLDDFKLVLVASNRGNRPGAIKSASLIFGKYSYDLTIEGNRVIEPGKTEVIRLAKDPDVYYQFGYEGREVPYIFDKGFELNFERKRFSGATDTLQIHVDKVLNKETFTHSKTPEEIMMGLNEKATRE